MKRHEIQDGSARGNLKAEISSFIIIKMLRFPCLVNFVIKALFGAT